jgi:predicted enzyme related to lactoylglutathione lyase
VAKVQGIGGVFIYATDMEALARWYETHLGLTLQSWGQCHGTELPSRDIHPGARAATTTFSIFKAEQPLPDVRTARLNFRVSDLDALLVELRAAGQAVEDKVEEGDYGRFAWVRDAEGNRVELWEPPIRG